MPYRQALAPVPIHPRVSQVLNTHPTPHYIGQGPADQPSQYPQPPYAPCAAPDIQDLPRRPASAQNNIAPHLGQTHVPIYAVQRLNYNVPHISSYALTVEPKTALATFIEKGIITDVDDEQAHDQFHILKDKLEAFFKPYNQQLAEFLNCSLPKEWEYL